MEKAETIQKVEMNRGAELMFDLHCFILSWRRIQIPQIISSICVVDRVSSFARSSYIYSCKWLVLFRCRVLESICTYCFKVCESTEQSRTRLVWTSLHYVFTALNGVIYVRTFSLVLVPDAFLKSWCDVT